MTVLRVDHQKNYVVISKTVLEDPDLSFKAKGLWAYCMSRPDQWEFNVAHLAKVSKDKKNAVYSSLKELAKAGYVRKVQKNENGKFGSVDYEISELKKCLPQTDFPHAGFPHAGNQPLVNIDTKQVKKEVTVCYPPPVGGDSIPSKIKKRGHKEEVECSLDEIFKQAVFQKKSWTTQEINEAWKILFEYKGIIGDPLKFIDGTISNLRNKAKSDFLAQGKGNKECRKKEPGAYEKYKERNSAEGTKGQILVPLDLT